MGKVLRRVSIGMAGVLACCVSAFALDPSLDFSQYAHTAWKTREGFSKGNMLSIAQTPDGYLWISTELGTLLRFDGVRTVPAGQSSILRPGQITAGLLVILREFETSRPGQSTIAI